MPYKMMLLIWGLFIITACNQDSSNEKNKDKTTVLASTILPTSGKTSTNKLLDEGKIKIQITTPNNVLGKLLQEVDPSKGNIQNQMKTLGEELTAKERAQLEEQTKKMGLMNLAILMLPPKGAIYLKEGAATAKFDGLTYHGENTVNESKQTGMIYLKSQSSEKAVTVSYTGSSFKEMNTNELKVTDYEIVNTGEESVVAGYLCTKSIYTLKNETALHKSSYGMPLNGAYKLEVWTSKQMPKVVNFFHPIYINEDAGIMKILIQFQKESDLTFLYEFTSVENRPVTENEMKIKKTQIIRDFAKDKMKIGMEMMGIMFGM